MKNSITIPARGSVGPSGVSQRDLKFKKDGRIDRSPLQAGRKVAFHPPPGKGAGGDTDENTWILALVTKCLSSTKYEVQDAEPQEDGQPGVYVLPRTSLFYKIDSFPEHIPRI